jgi:hypothetical protein
LIRQGGDGVMVVPAVGKGRGDQTEAREQSQEGGTHTTSQEEKVATRNWQDELN